MTDRRLTPFSGRVGHVSLAGRIADAALTEGEPARILRPLAALRAAPGGAIDRQLLYGEAVSVIDRRDGHAFAMAKKDGYCGWLAEADLAPARAPTHRLITPASHLYPEPRVQAEPLHPLWLNALLTVVDSTEAAGGAPSGGTGAWARTPEGFVPARHLAPLGVFAVDPVTVAESLLCAPYLWGGNSAAGVDCSGLVQLAFHAAGRGMPADSDLQQALGADVAQGDEQRGDLVFWKGHVALVTGPDRIIHANGHSMNVAHETLSAASARIEGAGGGPILARKRV
ncbi:C40 family peptidase [Pseudogemmobacter sonorensis]|uniref:C40 family peptidase n=1 Tax=Pseudogemmobacter sonorensis TaxID=2989681 RepID=UPI0036C86B88